MGYGYPGTLVPWCPSVHTKSELNQPKKDGCFYIRSTAFCWPIPDSSFIRDLCATHLGTFQQGFKCPNCSHPSRIGTDGYLVGSIGKTKKWWDHRCPPTRVYQLPFLWSGANLLKLLLKYRKNINKKQKKSSKCPMISPYSQIIP